jgi:hypothetical protein
MKMTVALLGFGLFLAGYLYGRYRAIGAWFRNYPRAGR